MNTSQRLERGKHKPIVAIVGRPNVGKSTLFNKIVGWRKAIVEDIPGVTRDRNYTDTEWGGVEFSLVDTGGFDPGTEDTYLSIIKSQVEIAIEEADVILFVMDSTTGVMPQDREVHDVLRKCSKPVLYLLNKVDHENHETREYEFHSLGVDSFHNVSAIQGRNMYEMLDAVVQSMPGAPALGEKSDDDAVRVAVIGKPNVGKSTLINKILDEERLLTSPEPGTTRDSIDSLIEKDGKKYLLVDTAGIRRRSKINFSVEKHSVLRAIRAVERSDVVLLIIDGPEGPTHQDARLADLIEKKGKASAIVLNKWDLVPRDVAQTTGIEEITRDNLKAIGYCPVISVSSLTGKRVNKLFEVVDRLYSSYSRRLPTKTLNNFLEGIVGTNPPPLYRGREVKFYYVTQPRARPPTFVIFTNTSKGIGEGYKRFIENRLRDEFDFEGTPMKLIFRTKRKE
ncbi:MAG: ribosome biogenesis GTPase Der [Thermodesulfobacteriota bacterium]